jgi:hypothetical protein
MDISDASSTFHDTRQNCLPHTWRLNQQAWNQFASGQGNIIAELGAKGPDPRPLSTLRAACRQVHTVSPLDRPMTDSYDILPWIDASISRHRVDTATAERT